MGARLVDKVRSGKEELVFEIPEGKVLSIGRDVEGGVKNDIGIPNKREKPHIYVSREHAEVKCKVGKIYVSDEGSTHGTLAGKRKVGKEWEELSDGEILTLGGYYEFLVKYDAPKGDAEEIKLAPDKN